MKIKESWNFLGPRVSKLLLIGILVGVLFFVTDIAFAYGVQVFLSAIGIMAAGTAHFPSWIPSSNFIVVLLFILALGSLRGFLVGLQLYLQGVTSGEFRYLQRSRIIRNALFSPAASTSELTALFNARAEAAGSAISNLSVLAIQLTSAVPLALSLLYLAPIPTCAGGALLIVCVLPLRAADKQLQSVGNGLITEWNKTHHRLLQGIRNLLLLRIYGTQSEEESKAQESLSAFRGHMLAYYRAHGFRNAAPQVVGIFLLCAMTLVARKTGRMPPGLLLTYFYLFLRFVQSFAAVNQGITTFRLDRPQIDALIRWWREASIQERSQISSADRPKEAPITESVGWEASGIGFSYPNGAKPIFSHLNLRIDPGETVMITGSSGSGKSTLLYLILGMLDPQEGNIRLLLAGHSSKELSSYRSELLNAVGYVGPDSFLDEGTIMENLLYGLKGSPSSSEIRSVLETAECQFVFSLPKELEHRLTEQGQGLSAGQQQRLCLARALLRHPKILILDEATSNLDAETEEKLIDTLARLKGRMTIIAATHRPAFKKIADRSFHLALNEGSTSRISPAPGISAAVSREKIS